MATFGKKRIGLWNNDVTKIHESKTAWFEQYEINITIETSLVKTHKNNSKSRVTKIYLRKATIQTGQTNGKVTPDIYHMQRHL